jgi:hypothetical protein
VHDVGKVRLVGGPETPPASSDEKVLSWVDQSAQDGQPWRDASLISNTLLAVTAEELKRIQDDIQAALKPYRLRDRDAGDLPPEVRLAHAAVRLTPAASPPTGE